MTTMLSTQIHYDELVQDDRVNGRVYYDPGVFEDELEKIWYRDWIYVAHESEIPEPGDYVTRQIGLQPVIVSRDEDRRNSSDAQPLHASRQHRMPERTRQRARVPLRLSRMDLQQSGRAGRSARMPPVTTVRSRANDYPLAKVARTATYRGLIFASMSASGPGLQERLGKAAGLIDQFVDLSPEGEVVVRSGVLKHSFRGNWKMALENSVDGYHPNILHHAAMVMMTKERKVDMESVFGERSDALARDLGNGSAQLDLTPMQPRAWRPRGAARMERGGMAAIPQARWSERHGADRAREIIANWRTAFLHIPQSHFHT